VSAAAHAADRRRCGWRIIRSSLAPDAPPVTSAVPAIARRRRACVILAVAVLVGPLAATAQAPAPAAAQIREALPVASALLSRYALAHGAAAALRQVYAAGGDEPLWSHAGYQRIARSQKMHLVGEWSYVH